MHRIAILSLFLVLNLTNDSPITKQAAENVFRGFPALKISEGGLERFPEKLSREKAVNSRCIISKIGKDYYWASRENVRMVKIENGAFITFLAVNGSGYVRIINPELKEAASLMSATEETFDYAEHLLIGLRSISYWGVREQ